jgi:hypothetical protein
MTDWQPIETAPKDGTLILVFVPPSDYSIGWYNTEKYNKNPRPFWGRHNANHSKTVCRSRPPTHWMPLPEPPKEYVK